MITLQQNTSQQTYPISRLNRLKRVSVWVVTILTMVLILVAQADPIFADDDCKTATGQCSTSIGLYVG